MSVASFRKPRKRKGFVFDPIEPLPGSTPAQALEFYRARFYRAVCNFFWKHRSRNYLAAPLDAPLGLVAPPPYIVLAHYEFRKHAPDFFYITVVAGDPAEVDYIARHGDDDELARLCFKREWRILLSVKIDASTDSNPRLVHDFITGLQFSFTPRGTVLP